MKRTAIHNPAILNEWKFAPATKSGIPINYRTVVDVPFWEFSPKLKLQIPRDTVRIPLP